MRVKEKREICEPRRSRTSPASNYMSVHPSVRQMRSTHIRQHFWFVPHNGSFKQVQEIKTKRSSTILITLPQKHCPWSVNNKLKVYKTRGSTSASLTQLCKTPLSPTSTNETNRKQQKSILYVYR